MSTVPRMVGSRARIVAAISLCALLAATIGCSANEDLATDAVSTDENSAPADGDEREGDPQGDVGWQA